MHGISRSQQSYCLEAPRKIILSPKQETLLGIRYSSARYYQTGVDEFGVLAPVDEL